MSKALYRKYRSRSLDEIVGQQPIVESLKNAIKNNQLSHAYLFTGPRGVGKTSIARILAYNINNIPYDSDSLPLDIIEIDAASNRRIDEIRDLREKVNIAPVSAKYKVYIIDEVHMLTREAFNALLKTLEEPPKHVIFILATTEAHKLPETIVSRTQKYNFSLASAQAVKDHLGIIAKKESIAIDDDALELLAIHSGGSLRDSLSLLDQVRHSGGKITAKTVRQNLGIPPADLVNKVISALESGDIKDIILSLDEARASGVTSIYLAEQLNTSLRQLLINNKLKFSSKKCIELMQRLLTIESSNKPDLALELALIQIQLNNDTSFDIKAQTMQPPITLRQPVESSIKNITHKQLEEKNKNQAAVTVTPDKVLIDDEIWANALEHIRQTHNTLYSLLRMAKTDNSEPNKLTLYFNFQFHQKRVNENKNKAVISDTLSQLGVDNCQIQCETAKNADKREYATVSNSSNPKSNNDNFIKQIKSVFGEAEVLE